MTDEQVRELALAIDKGFEQLARSMSGERNLSSAVVELAKSVDRVAEAIQATNRDGHLTPKV